MALSRAWVVTAATTALVTSLALSASASGGGWLRLGSHNSAFRSTTLVDHGRGPALRLETRTGAPPLAVNSSKRVARLNVDRLDGVHAAALRTLAYIYRIGGDEDWGPHLVKEFPGLPSGQYYLATYQMRMVLYGGGDASCWFTTATQSRVGYSVGSTNVQYGTVVLTGSALLDARKPITLHCVSGTAYDTIASDSSADSRVTFLRVAPTRPRWATTDESRMNGRSSTTAR